MDNINEIINILKEGGSIEIIEDDIKTLNNNGDYTFKISGKNNPKLNKEINSYISGENKLIQTHDLIYNKDLKVYQYKKRPVKHATGGFITYEPIESSGLLSTYSKKIKSWMDDLFPKYDEIVDNVEEQPQVQNPAPQQTDHVAPAAPKSNSDAKPITTSANTPIPTNLNLKGWDLQKTLQHLRSHAHEKSTHWCAKYVRQALEAGGLVGFRVGNAKDEVQKKTLESIGFSRVAEAMDEEVTKGYIPQAGDIAITYTNGNHASMYDGTRWISDFRQNSIDVYRNRKGNKAIIYRRISGDGKGTSTGSNFTANGDIINKVVAASKLGYFMDPSWKTKTTLGNNAYKKRCTSGPATFYHAAGIELNGYWWKNKDGKAVDYLHNPVGTNLDKVGFVKVWEGTADDARNNKAPCQPGDIALSFGTTPSHVHAQMWNGENYVSDTVQNKAWVFGNEDGRFELWRYKGAGSSTTSTENNVILINKTQRTLTINGKTFKVSISKNGLEQTSKSGDGLTPEGEFSLGNKESKGGYNDSVYGWRPNAYGGRFYRLSGGIAQGRGFGIHGSDQYNDPNKYQQGKIGTHGCIALKNDDLTELETIMEQNGGPTNFKVKIIKGEHGGKFQKSRTVHYKYLNS